MFISFLFSMFHVLHFMLRQAITQIYNAILQTEYFPCQWKAGQIIMIVKPVSNPNYIISYGPINLLPTLSKDPRKKKHFLTT
jgi:hypothetical protein